MLNGTSVTGLAATWGDKIENKGFEVGAVTNTNSTFEDSVVMFEPGAKPEAKEVAETAADQESRADDPPKSPKSRTRPKSRSSSARTMPRRKVDAAAVVFALLVVATLAAFAYAQRVKRDPLVVDRVGIGGKKSNAFTPAAVHSGSS